ncbi:glycosyl hydrolase [Nocardiopsis gilva YIM 90087]|uniref:Glycosyl hydrolase n=1 Tax=Nocardiopsis gilva YIM 90087 TaxID=1235441 RepID=A0A223S6N7_9ACTN|nr:family 10 glycosylhydrolase [Nocardiopsis gilva]ASU83773.1 glycosyl hydrolase [Nocardiopsis gilva YIM 90087]
MGRFGGGAIAVAVMSLLAGCSSVPPGAEPDVGDPDAAAAEARPPGAIPDDCDADAAVPKRQMRGVWLTTVRNIDWPSADDLSESQQKKELIEQLDRARELGLNAVFFHARPTADAVYRSEKEPWARYLTGTQGGDPGYDPLEFATTEAHKRGLELHAWFNPYRVGWDDPDLENLAEDHPVKKHPDWLIEYDDQGWMDPGNPEVRAWVGDVVLDVVDRYDIDGVHFDDYFYPYPDEDGSDFGDDGSWKKYRGDFTDRGDWRRDNVNRLIAEIHDRIERRKPWVRFGVSPFGIWRNESTDPAGSATKGLESYDAQYADTRAWIQEGTIDYVTPQVYWPQGFTTADYATLVPWWAEQVAGTDVDLYIGQAAYKVGDDGWEGSDALSRQLDFNSERPEVTGDVFFSMKSLNDVADDAIEEVAAEHYRRPALPPRAAGDAAAPEPVTGLEAERSAEGVRLVWDTTGGARFHAVYRVPDNGGEDLCALADAAHLLAVVGGNAAEGKQAFTDTDPADGAVRYYVTALDDHRVESAPSPAVRVDAGKGG